MIKFHCKEYPKLLADWRKLNSENIKKNLPELRISEFIHQSGLTSIWFSNSSDAYWELTDSQFAWLVLKWG